MKLLWVCTMGIGNIVETIPAYLNARKLVRDTGGTMDIVYKKEYPTDNIGRAGVFPDEVQCELMGEDQVNLRAKLVDYIIELPLIYDGGGVMKKQVIEMRENDSEVRRNLRTVESIMDEPAKMYREWREDSIEIPCGKYITVHNGALAGWDDKKYPKMNWLLDLVRNEYPQYELVSIGSKKEYIPGLSDYTGLPLRQSMYVISHSSLHISSDTGTMHMAAICETPGVVIFTWTSPVKNWDKEFHHSITPVWGGNCKKQPCQMGYHISVSRRECSPSHCNPHTKTRECQDFDPDIIMDAIKERLG